MSSLFVTGQFMVSHCLVLLRLCFWSLTGILFCMLIAVSLQDDFNFEKRDWMTVRPGELPTGSKLV